MTMMLASPSKEFGPDPQQVVIDLVTKGFVAERKWDGVRCWYEHDTGTVTLRSGNVHDVRGFEFHSLAHSLLPAGTVLDCEVVLLDVGRSGTIDEHSGYERFRDTMPVLTSGVGRLHLTAFDLVTVGGMDVRPLPLTDRRVLLSTLTPASFREDQGRTSAGPVDVPMRLFGHTPQYHDLAAVQLYDTMAERGHEGVILKDPGSTYVGRRAPTWVKAKVVHHADLLVLDYQPGTGNAEGVVGALILRDPVTRDVVGKVGTGFTHAQRAELADLLDGGAELMVEIEHAGRTVHGKYRFPSFRRHEVVTPTTPPR